MVTRLAFANALEPTSYRDAVQPAVAADLVLAYARNHAAERQGRWADPSRALMIDNSAAYQALCEALNALKQGWRITENGIIGPDHAMVRLGQRHPSSSDGHLDIQFVLHDGPGEKAELWDCVSGFGSTPVERAQTAAHLWARTTLPALLELKYSRRGEFADHYHGNESDGFTGWHVISGAIMGFGHGDSPHRLQEWWLANPLLPFLSTALGDALDEETCPHGIKIFFGGDGVAEVRLDGERHERASMVLASLDWPRLEPAGFVRSYVLVLHRETTHESS
jgi:hypothetical protein